MNPQIDYLKYWYQNNPLLLREKGENAKMAKNTVLNYIRVVGRNFQKQEMSEPTSDHLEYCQPPFWSLKSLKCQFFAPKKPFFAPKMAKIHL